MLPPNFLFFNPTSLNAFQQHLNWTLMNTIALNNSRATSITSSNNAVETTPPDFSSSPSNTTAEDQVLDLSVPKMPKDELVDLSRPSTSLSSSNAALEQVEEEIRTAMNYSNYRNTTTATTVIDIEGNGYQCPECGKFLPTSAGLKRHLFYHKKPTINTLDCPYRCSSCPAAFSYRASLLYHRLSHSLDGSERMPNGLFKCNACEQTFDGLKSFKRHKMKQPCNNILLSSSSSSSSSSS